MQKQRIETRREYGMPMEVILSAWDEPVELVAGDLSPRGAFIYNDLLPDIGEHLVCSFAVPGMDREFSFFSEVTRVNMMRRKVDYGRPGFGVKFIDAGPLDRLRIRKGVSSANSLDPAPSRDRRGFIISLGTMLVG